MHVDSHIKGIFSFEQKMKDFLSKYWRVDIFLWNQYCFSKLYKTLQETLPWASFVCQKTKVFPSAFSLWEVILGIILQETELEMIELFAKEHITYNWFYSPQFE